MSHMPVGWLKLREQQALRVLATVGQPLDVAQLSAACARRARPTEVTLQRLARRGMVQVYDQQAARRYAAADEWWLHMRPTRGARMRTTWRHTVDAGATL